MKRDLLMAATCATTLSLHPERVGRMTRIVYLFDIYPMSVSFSSASLLYSIYFFPFCGFPIKLEDATFQVYKDGDYGNYLDVEATLNEQSEELEGFLEK